MIFLARGLSRLRSAASCMWSCPPRIGIGASAVDSWAAGSKQSSVLCCGWPSERSESAKGNLDIKAKVMVK
eukprot:scaffold21064_cov31-Tisochrysis_lutea.AAC.4